EQQDQRIMDYQRKLSAGKVNIEEQIKARNLLQNVQRILEPVKVVNPFAEILQLPKEVLKPRRTNAHYLQFIEIVTYYHQFQREKKVDEETGEEYIETTIEDISNANYLLKEVLLRKSDILTGKSRNLLETLKQKLKNKQEPFTNQQLRHHLRISKTTAQRYLNGWMDEGIIIKLHNKETQTYHYQIINEKEYQQLENKIDNVLNEVIKKIENRNTEPQPNQQQNGAVKTKKENKLS